MSTKQMANAAVKGRRLTVNLPGAEPLLGYLVGMDDFHWLVAEVSTEASGLAVEVSTHLVHKTAPSIRIDHQASLSDESSHVQAAVQEIGGSFFAHCRERILTHSPASK